MGCWGVGVLEGWGTWSTGVRGLTVLEPVAEVLSLRPHKFPACWLEVLISSALSVTRPDLLRANRDGLLIPG
jgi:hypothetical protein